MGEEKFRIYHLHGLGSSCRSTKSNLVRDITESLGGSFRCFDFDYLLEGERPWHVLNRLREGVSWDRPFVLVGSSMGAYSWLDYMVNEREIFETENFRKAILITPPTTIFDNLEKWNPVFGRERLFLRYGKDYVVRYADFIELMHWDLKFANLRLLTLAEPKVVSILAKRDTVVDNGPIYRLIEVARRVNFYEIDDEHPLRNRLDELEKVLRREIEEAVKDLL